MKIGKRDAIIAALITGAAVIIAALIGLIPSPFSGGGTSAVTSSRVVHTGASSCEDAKFNGSHNDVDCSLKVVRNGLSKNPRARIVQLTGSWSEQRFVEAIVERNLEVVALYLKSGLSATTFHKDASAILWGFQGAPQNGDPVALLKTFQADGFEVDEPLEDSYLMSELTEGFLPLPFETDLTPKGYIGNYQFVGSLLFWIVQRATWTGPTSQDDQVIDYLIDQGADCEVPLSFLRFNRDALGGTSPYKELLLMMDRCGP